MALQTKTFSWGSYAYQSESNAYVLELKLTENSTSTANNTSSVSYELILKSGNQNRFTGDVDSVIKLNGSVVASSTYHVTAAYNSSWTLQSGTATVKHNSDGSLNMPIEVSINTYNSYAPPDKTLNWSWTLTKINLYTACTAPTSFTLSPELYEDGVTLTWSGAKGGTNNSITGYEVQWRRRSAENVWGDWLTSAITTSGTVTSPSGVDWGGAVQYRVRTKGSAGSSYYSDWKVSNVAEKVNPVAHIHNGTAYESYAVYIHDGTNFARYAPYIHNGTSWELYV